MSLLKAQKFSTKAGKGYTDYGQQFLAIIATAVDGYTRDDLKYLILIYSNVSALYVKDIATTLQTPKDIKEMMSYMNSYIAEITNELKVPYYHPEEGYTVIDKALQYVLDAGEELTKTDFIEEFIVEFEEVRQKMEELDLPPEDDTTTEEA